ncbi:hypothetical protein ACFPU0_13515 [Pseudomonas sp. GCM10022186]|uniref:hypothetical protein n=1 Tax=Pseudomonas sp. GCM10022186 TaxID=3252650 RepID=UPI00360DD7D7
MNTTTKLCLTLIACAFAAAYITVVSRPLPPALAAQQMCQSSSYQPGYPPGYPPCYMPAPTIASLLP